jgi:LacI family transcriptional regulator
MASGSNIPKNGARGTETARPGRPTIDDVAALAGVGRATVSRALNDQANVSAKMRARVMQAVEALDFRVNPQARNLASRTSNALTLINCNALDADPNSYYFAALELGALRAAAIAGFELSTFNVHVEDRRRYEKVIELFESGRSAGLILSPPLSADATLAAQLIAHRCPVVCISPSEEVHALLPSVGFDEEAAGYEIARHVVETGHRRFGYLLGIEGHFAAEHRFAGFLRALAEAGLGIDQVTTLRGDFSFRSGVELAQQLLDQPARPSIIVCANDDMAVGALFAAHRMNLDIPADLSIVGFDDAPIAAHIWPPLTTIHQPIRRIAARAVERLTEALLSGRSGEGGIDLIDYHLVLRDSVAPPAN